MHRMMIRKPGKELQQARAHARTLLAVLVSNRPLSSELPPRACAATALGLALGFRAVDKPSSTVEDAMGAILALEKKCCFVEHREYLEHHEYLPFETSTGFNSLSADVLIQLHTVCVKPSN